MLFTVVLQEITNLETQITEVDASSPTAVSEVVNAKLYEKYRSKGEEPEVALANANEWDILAVFKGTPVLAS